MIRAHARSDLPPPFLFFNHGLKSKDVSADIETKDEDESHQIEFSGLEPIDRGLALGQLLLQHPDVLLPTKVVDARRRTGRRTNVFSFNVGVGRPAVGRRRIRILLGLSTWQLKEVASIKLR